METVYIETTIISYLVAEPKADAVTAARQEISGGRRGRMAFAGGLHTAATHGMIGDMKTDTVLAEMFRVKDNLGERFAWDARAICADLMVKQRQPHPGFPLVENLSASLSTHAQRIAGLPSPVPTEDFMPDDPIIAEVHRIRERLARESQASPLILKDEPPRPKS